MSNEISWSTHLCVDGSVEYRADAPALMCDYDSWAVDESGVPALSEQSRIDVVVSSQRHPLDAWLVEVKDYRRLSRNASHPAQAARVAQKLDRIGDTLTAKLDDSLDFIESAFLHSLAAQRVNSSILRRDDTITADPALPWSVCLLPVGP